MVTVAVPWAVSDPAEQIVSATASYLQIEVKDILGNKRSKKVVMARHMSMALCRSLLGMSYPALGKFFGGKDHSTVLYSINKISKMQTENEDVNNMFLTLSKKCRQLSQA